MRPLDGVRVIDLTVAVAGPVATSLLADMGAEVIRIEPPWPRSTAHLEVTPRIEGAPDHPYNRIVSYNDLHRGKRAITLDLASDAGREVLLRLVETTDAVIENMSPRVLPSLRLGYDDLRAARRDIVLVSMPAFGEGPLRDRVSYGPGIDAMSGLAHLTGYADRGPMNPANYYADYNTALLAALATVAALRHRDRTGEGQRTEISMLEGEMQVVGDALMDFALNGRNARRSGNAHPTIAPHGVYPCVGDDRWIAIACEDDLQWQALCGCMQQPKLARDRRYADVVSRLHARLDLDPLISGWTRAQEPHDAMARLRAAGVPAGIARSVGELFDDPVLAARDYIRFVDHPEAGAFPHARPAFTLSKTPAHTDRPAPLYGADAQYVFGGLLGMSEAEISALVASGVTALEPPPKKRTRTTK